MAKDEEIVVSEGTDSNKQYVTATFERGDKVLDKYQLLRNVGTFSARDVVVAGIEHLWASKEFKEKARMLKDAL